MIPWTLRINNIPSIAESERDDDQSDEQNGNEEDEEEERQVGGRPGKQIWRWLLESCCFRITLDPYDVQLFKKFWIDENEMTPHEDDLEFHTLVN